MYPGLQTKIQLHFKYMSLTSHFPSVAQVYYKRLHEPAVKDHFYRLQNYH